MKMTTEISTILKTGGRKRTKRVIFALLLGMCFVMIVLDIPFSPSRFLRAHININNYDSSFRSNRSIGKVFIAVNLYQSESLLRDGSWTGTMMELIDQFGPNNVYLSIFENNSTDATPQLLQDFEKRVKCEHTIVTTKLNFDDHQYTSIYTKNSTHRSLSRIAYLAMVRNRALEPLLHDRSHVLVNGSRRYSKLLFLNDVVFSSQDALRLLQTNYGDYAATCALDFINPIKFYDTLATRDTDGYSMGLPLYPFFSPGQSQSQIRRGDSLVRVKSCWSGMVAFDSLPFENGLQFRSLNNESSWDASECCLIHADIDQPKRTFINSVVRVAYSSTVYRWQKRLAQLKLFGFSYRSLLHTWLVCHDTTSIGHRLTVASVGYEERCCSKIIVSNITTKQVGPKISLDARLSHHGWIHPELFVKKAYLLGTF